MRESEHTVLERAKCGDEIPQRICTQLLDDTARYTLWHAQHEMHMNGVANARRRERQVLKLRGLAIEQIHRTSLVRYLRDYRITGNARDRTLRAFYGINDTRDSALAEHRTYLLAASTQLCTSDILELVGDQQGDALVRSYELAYGQYFAMFCDRARALQTDKPYLLTALMPEVRDVAERLRLRILDTKLLPVRPIYMLSAAATKTPRREPQRTLEARNTATAKTLATALRDKLGRQRPARTTWPESLRARYRALQSGLDRPR